MRALTIGKQGAYFHGTSLNSAVLSLLDGEPLMPLRPKGTAKFSRSKVGYAYLSPSFGQAAEYARMRSRVDWPALGSESFHPVPHVFEFDLEGVEAIPDEDELGYAAFVALCAKEGASAHWSMNSEFAQAIRDDQDFLAALTAETERILREGRHAKLLESPRRWTGANKTAVGKAIRDKLSEETLALCIDLGVSVAIQQEVWPHAYYPMPKTITKIGDGDRHGLHASDGDNGATEYERDRRKNTVR